MSSRKIFFLCTSLMLIFSFKYIYLVLGGTSESAIHFPTTEWLQGDPKDFGLNSEYITNMTDYLNVTVTPVEHITISKNGYMLTEYYGPFSGGNQNFTYYHVAKGIAAILTGIAIDQAILPNVSTSLWAFFNISNVDNVNAQKEAIKLQHLLTCTSGIQWDEESVRYSNPSSDFNVWRSSNDWVNFVLDRPMEANPGELFRYNSGATHLLNYIIAQQINTTIREFATQYLFAPLGIQMGDWTTDPEGIHDGASGIHISGRDLAKIGLLLLNNGTWDNQQIISSNYVKEMFTDHFNVGYGYQFWLENATTNGENVWSCRGIFDAKRITLIFKHQLVVTMTCYTGEDWNSRLMTDYIIPACSTGTNGSNESSTGTNGSTDVLISMPVLSIIIFAAYRKRKDI